MNNRWGTCDNVIYKREFMTKKICAKKAKKRRRRKKSHKLIMTFVEGSIEVIRPC